MQQALGTLRPRLLCYGQAFLCQFELCKKIGIKKPLKSFKKTSASLLRGEERFQNLEDLFLGHAPKKISDKHYTEVPARLLDKATTWLEEQYAICEPQ